jgi:hypothetical protein
MTVTTARVLYAVLHDNIDARWRADATDAEGKELSVLLRRGWIREIDGRFVLSEEVALGLDPGTD